MIAVILYSEAKREDFSTQALYETEVEVYPRSKIVKKEIEKLGYKVFLLPGNKHLIQHLGKIKPDIVFNLVDSLYGREELCSVIPALLEAERIPYTGAGIDGMSLNMNKYLTKIYLKQSGLPVPKFQFFEKHSDTLLKSFNFPLITKLNRFHGSVEIDQKAVVEDESQLRQRLKYLLSRYKGGVLVEEYIKGKEITAMIVDKQKKPLILAEERIFFKKKKYQLFGFEEAWSDEEVYDCVKYMLPQKVKKDIRYAFDLLQMRDYGRFEIIFDKRNRHFFIDVNTNPAFGPWEAGEAFGYLLHINKISFTRVAQSIIENAKKRFKRNSF